MEHKNPNPYPSRAHKMLTLLEAAWISILFARCANFRVLCVSSLLLDAGVIVHINCSQIHSHFSMTSLQCSNFFVVVTYTGEEGHLLVKHAQQRCSWRSEWELSRKPTEICPWPLNEDCNRRVSLESR